MKKFIAFFRDGIFEEWLGRIAILCVIIPVIINIVNRSFLNHYSLEIEAIALFAYVWVGYGFFGYMYRVDDHVDVKFVVNMLPPMGQRIFELIRDIFIFAFSSYLCYWGFKLCKGNFTKHVAGTNIPYVYAYASITFGFFSGAVRSGWALCSRVIRLIKGKEGTAE